MAVWTTTDSSEEARAFLQRRVAMFGFFSGLLFFLGWVARVALGMQIAGAAVLTDGNVLWHGVAVVCFSMVWVLCQGGDHSIRYLRAVESIGVLAGCMSFMVMSLDIPPQARPELILTLTLTYGLSARSVYVPSAARHTLLLGAAIAPPFMATTYLIYRDVPPVYLGMSTPIFISMVTMLYWGTSVVICVGASKVIYGLRKEVRSSRRLGQYVLEDKLGEGGMGMVYRASHALLRRPTAVKLILPERAGPEHISRFEREAQLTARLTHPNTVTIFDYGRTPDGIFYYAMELLDGATITEVVEVCGPQPPERVLSVLGEVSSALNEAHQIGLIHRDIKPSNIMLCTVGGVQDTAKVLDFGLVTSVSSDVPSNLTQTGVITGTPLYMSPEAIKTPEESDARSDLYALGAVAYYLLTGTHVFTGKTVIDICLKQVSEAPEAPSSRLGEPVPADLERIILDCLEKDPAARPQSAGELLRRVRACESYGTWEGAWWWEEYGEAVRDVKRTAAGQVSARTLDVRLAERT